MVDIESVESRLAFFSSDPSAEITVTQAAKITGHSAESLEEAINNCDLPAVLYIRRQNGPRRWFIPLSDLKEYISIHPIAGSYKVSESKLSINQAAAMLDCAPQTIRRAITGCRLPAVQTIGGCRKFLIEPADLENYAAYQGIKMRSAISSVGLPANQLPELNNENNIQDDAKPITYATKLTIEDAAQRIEVSSMTVRRAIKRGDLATTRGRNRMHLIDPKDLDAFRDKYGFRNRSISAISSLESPLLRTHIASPDQNMQLAYEFGILAKQLADEALGGTQIAKSIMELALHEQEINIDLQRQVAFYQRYILVQARNNHPSSKTKRRTTKRDPVSTI